MFDNDWDSPPAEAMSERDAILAALCGRIAATETLIKVVLTAISSAQPVLGRELLKSLNLSMNRISNADQSIPAETQNGDLLEAILTTQYRSILETERDLRRHLDSIG